MKKDLPDGLKTNRTAKSSDGSKLSEQLTDQEDGDISD